ncbi:hypothetical protein [Aquimarina pacifica]|uniref:hypothetical protein n=1 Tax=Aquimarina pacifica TaxID=1296415 RepID=UPI0004709DDA|nr:hypothetical protein [Aquimarina pacifica]
MSLTQLAYQILIQLPIEDIRIAAKDFGLSHSYFKQKVKSVDTDKEDLFRAVESMVAAHNIRDQKIKESHKIFLTHFKNINKK